jgi:hypothetical protein
MPYVAPIKGSDATVRLSDGIAHAVLSDDIIGSMQALSDCVIYGSWYTLFNELHGFLQVHDLSPVSSHIATKASQVGHQHMVRILSMIT